MSTGEAAMASPNDVLVYLLKHGTRRLTAMTDEALRPLEIDSKDLGALRVLAGREQTSQLEVAHLLGVDRTTMVSILDVLQSKDMVTRRPDPSDRRRNVVELTAHGSKTYTDGEAASAEAERAFLAAIDHRDHAELRRMLRALIG